MKELIGINSGMLFANYEKNRRRLLIEQTLFWVGVLAAVIAPELFWSFSQGTIGFTTFGITAVAGISLGLVRYYRFPFRINYCVSDVAPRAPSNSNAPLRWKPEAESTQRRGSQENRRPKLATF